MPDYILSDEYFDRLYWPRIYLWWQETRGAEVLITIDGFDVTDPYLVYDSLRVEQRADTFVSTCHFELVDEAGILDLREKQVVVVEDGGHRYFAGKIANINKRNMAGGTTTLMYTIECQDYNILVEEVIIDQLEQYGATLDADIIDDLFDKYLPEVNSHQPGDAPPGYVQPLHVFAEIEFEAISLREALDRIASEVPSVALEGFWYIDFYKRLHYFNVEDNAPAWYLSDTPDDVTSFAYFNEITQDRQGAAITNRILVVGAEVALFVQDYDSRDYYNRWFEGIIRDNSLITPAEVMEHGYSLLAKWAYPDESFDISIRQTGLRAGMNVRFENTLFNTRTRVNLIHNPSLEVDLASWTLDAGGGPGELRDNTYAAVGNWSCRLTAGNAANSEEQSNIVTVEPGVTVTIQVRTYRVTDIGCEIALRDVTNNVDRNTISPSLTGSWEILTCSWTNPFAVPVNIEIRVRNTEADNASHIWFDACMAEIDKGPYPLEYIDGSLPYCDWDGAAHASTSHRPPVYMIRQLTVTWPQNTATFALTLGGTVTGTALIKSRLAADSRRRSVGPVVPGQLPLSSRGWSHDLTFSATDDDTVAWTGGDLQTAAGQTFALNAGNTGNMTAATVNYIYLDTDTSLVNLQVTEAGPPVGLNMILVAVAFPADDATEAMFTVFGGGDGGIGIFIAHNNIAAETITGNEIAANAIVAGHINVGQLDAISVDAGVITAGEIQTDVAGNDRVVLSAVDGLIAYSAADVIQFHVNPVTGTATAGAGAVVLDENGLTIETGVGAVNWIGWAEAGTLRGTLFVNYAALTASMYIYAGDNLPGGGSSNIRLHALDPGGVATGTRFWIDSAGAGSITAEFNNVLEMTLLPVGMRLVSLAGGGNQDVGADNVGLLYVPFVSDAKFKQDVEPIIGALEAVCALRGVTFNWSDAVEELGLDFGDRRQIGLIAQDVEPYIPLAVCEPKGYKSVDVKKIIPYLVEAIKELEARCN